MMIIMIIIIIPTFFLQQAVDQLHSNHMGIEKTCLLAPESACWVNMNDGIQKSVKGVQHVLNFSKYSLWTKLWPYFGNTSQGDCQMEKHQSTRLISSYM